MNDRTERQLFREWVENKLNQFGSMVLGNQKFQAERTADLVEQIDELRKKLKRVSDKQDRMAEYIKTHVPKKNGGSE